MKLYDWQKKVITNYSGSGTVKAVTGAGKSLVGIELAKKCKGKVLVASHRNSILDQWKILLQDLDNVEYQTFNTLCKEKHHSPVELLIIDECHRSTSPEFIKLYDNIEYNHIIGLSATPNEKSIEKCGPLLCDVGYDDANISPFRVIFHGINLNPMERSEYYRLSKSISNRIKKLKSNKKFNTKTDKVLQTLIMKRRGVVYNANSRIPLATKLIEENYNDDKKILVICQRIDQVDIISEQLNKKCIGHLIYHSKHQDNLDEYRSGRVKVCLSVGMLTHGFNDVDTDVGIIVSTTLSESFNIQSIGRVIRKKDGKFANIHILLANHTTDTNAMRFKDDYNYDFELHNIFVPDDKRLVKAWNNGEKYSFLINRIWRKKGRYREYMEEHPITKELRKLKPSGGRFSVYNGKAYVKVDERIKKVPYNDFIKLTPKVEEKKTISWDDLWK